MAARREMREQTRERHLGRDLERPLQRDPVPLGRRPRDADDRHAAGALSLCRHPLVFDDVRPRRPDHGAADAVVDRRTWRAACCAGWPLIRPRPTIRSPTPSPEKSCTRCAAARWRRCAKCRSASITAASIRRRCSCLLAGLYAERTGDIETIARAVAHDRGGAGLDRRPGRSRRRRLCRISSAPASRASPTRAGRILHDAIFHADGRLAEGHIALAEVQGYVYAAKRLAARCARRLGRDARRATSSRPKRKQLAERFEAAFWCPDIETYALALDGAKKPCRVRTSNAGQVLFTGIAAAGRAPRWSRADCCSRASSPAGASARWRRASPATIRCRITTARSGRTTTR